MVTAEQLAKSFYASTVDGFESIGRSVESVPGWNRVERFLDDIADGFAFGIALLWAMRWIWAFLIAMLILVSATTPPN